MNYGSILMIRISSTDKIIIIDRMVLYMYLGACFGLVFGIFITKITGMSTTSSRSTMYLSDTGKTVIFCTLFGGLIGFGIGFHRLLGGKYVSLKW